MKRYRTRRTQGTGTIYLHGDRWRAQLRWTENGTKRVRTKVCDTKKEAELALSLFASERDGLVALKVPKNISELLCEWSNYHSEVSTNTKASYEWSIAKLNPVLGKSSLSLSTSQIESALDSYDLSPRSKTTLKRVLSMSFDYAVRQRYVTSNPVKASKPIRLERKEAKPWSRQELEAFTNATKTDRLGALWFLCASLGLRRGEALALRWSDYDTEQLTLSITKSRKRAGVVVEESATKTVRSLRTLPIFPVVKEVLEAHKLEQSKEIERLASLGVVVDDDYMFTNHWGKPLSPDSTSASFKLFAKKAGLGDMHIHELRHQSASILLANGVPMSVISRLLGHSSTGVTDSVYAHLDVEGLREALGQAFTQD